MRWGYWILGLGVLVTIPSQLMGVEIPTVAPGYAMAQDSFDTPLVVDSTSPFIDESDTPAAVDAAPLFSLEPLSLAPQRSYFQTDPAARFGWWAIRTRGNPNKVGEFQSLKSSPFWDVDRLSSNGTQTLDFFLNGTDSESNQAGLYFFRPGISADIDYERFLHRLDHDTLDNFRDPPADGSAVAVQDTNIGEDYAIRVQELKANFKGKVTENIRWRLNVWTMRKSGERQVDATGHCFHDGGFNPLTCHVVSQRQQIDWLTTEIEPAVEVRIGAVTAEYSRTMRSFTQNDQTVTRDYTTLVPNSFNGADLPYAVVPDNYTQVDRLKLGVDLTTNTDFYGNLFLGDTVNRHRNIRREFGGFDLRLTNRSIDGLALTAFAKRLDQRGQRPDTLLDDGTETDPDLIRDPINRIRTTAGARGRWRPFRGNHSLRRLSFTGGYEYRMIDRENVTYDLDNVADTSFTQGDTISHLVHVGPSIRWSPCFDSYIRFKARSIDYPLSGLQRLNILSLDSAVNSGLPESEYLVEIGGTWTPSDSFLLSASFWVEKRHHSSDAVDFDESSYPLVLSAWYAPTCKWSLSAGYATYTDWIDQDITLGSVADAFTSRWSYGGRSNIVNVGASYAWSERLTLKGSTEYVNSRNAFATPPSPNPGVVDYADLPGLSDVVVETTRFRIGVDYWLRKGITCYFYYDYFDYEDQAGNGNSGTASMFLSGVTASY